MYCKYRGYKIEFSDTFIVVWGNSSYASYRTTLEKAKKCIDAVLKRQIVSMSLRFLEERG